MTQGKFHSFWLLPKSSLLHCHNNIFKAHFTWSESPSAEQTHNGWDFQLQQKRQNQMSYLICQVIYLRPSIFLWQGDCKCCHITHLLQFPTLSSSPGPVCHSLDILCHCPPQQRASPPMDRDISPWFSVLKRAEQDLWDETNTQHAPVPWHSV